jgi:endonuclease YncB( thermonuclease family)
LQTLTTVLLCWAVNATPAGVIDGDTFRVHVRPWLGQTNYETVRLLGVNTPERRGATREAAEAARAFTATWLQGAELRLQVWERDAFGRVLATVQRAGDPESLSDALLRSGHAVPYKR